MTTNHFNQLTESEAERLAILIEECAEVQHIACKILRHGYESYHPANTERTNRVLLTRAMGDLAHAMNRLLGAKDVQGIAIAAQQEGRDAHMRPYLHHQPE